MFTEVAPGCFSAASRFVDGQNGVVVGRRCALAIDCSNYRDEGRAMADFIRERGHEPERVALTHGHGDHILGAEALVAGEVFAHALTPEKIREELDSHAEKLGVTATEAEALLPWPTVTYSEELRIDLGGKTVWMFQTPGHSSDGVSMLVEEDRVLYSGDSVVNGIVAAIGDGDSRVLERSLTRLLDVDVEILVPGHGFPIEGSEAVRDWLTWQRGYLRAVRDRVDEILATGGGEEAAVEGVDFGTFIGDRLPADRNGMQKRHRNTVVKIVEEVTVERGV